MYEINTWYKIENCNNCEFLIKKLDYHRGLIPVFSVEIECDIDLFKKKWNELLETEIKKENLNRYEKEILEEFPLWLMYYIGEYHKFFFNLTYVEFLYPGAIDYGYNLFTKHVFDSVENWREICYEYLRDELKELNSFFIENFDENFYDEYNFNELLKKAQKFEKIDEIEKFLKIYDILVSCIKKFEEYVLEYLDYKAKLVISTLLKNEDQEEYLETILGDDKK